jgi:NAD(P)-dependent dehydrogenase (short-subunit alcohol dehydrogenase family)
MPGLCEGRVVVITGAGNGIGRAEALECARLGARVAVNDLGVAVDGISRSSGPADAVVEEIGALGGEAIANADDVADFDATRHLVESAVEHFGRLDAMMNNAGILRDRMLVNMGAEEWDAVVRVHLRGTFAPSHWAAAYWRDRAKSGHDHDARIVNTSSASGIYGNPGQANYGAAKAGIAAFTVITAMKLGRYGVTVNAIAPGARTRMTEGLMPATDRVDRDEVANRFDESSPENGAPLVAWLVSSRSSGVTERVFNILGGSLSVAEGWHAGPGIETGARFDPEQLTDLVTGLVAEAAPHADKSGHRPPVPPR